MNNVFCVFLKILMNLSEKATNPQKEPPQVPSVEPMLVSGRNCLIVLHSEHSMFTDPPDSAPPPHSPTLLYLPCLSLYSQNPALLVLVWDKEK